LRTSAKSGGGPAAGSGNRRRSPAPNARQREKHGEKSGLHHGPRNGKHQRKLQPRSRGRAQGSVGRAVGIWQDIGHFESEITGGDPLTAAQKAFLQGVSLRSFYTTGCNIPIFVAAHASREILPVTPNDTFEWHNFYDEDDILGWPLADLSPQYKKIVTDHPINAGGGIMEWMLKSWNPLSHSQYWGDDDVLDPLEEHLRALLA